DNGSAKFFSIDRMIFCDFIDASVAWQCAHRLIVQTRSFCYRWSSRSQRGNKLVWRSSRGIMPPHFSDRVKSYLLFAGVLSSLLCLHPSKVLAQQPFYTDDTDVTNKGKLHFQFSNEYDLLQRISYPARTQNTAVFELDYGL